jgi:hypothetical protein
MQAKQVSCIHTYNQQHFTLFDGIEVPTPWPHTNTICDTVLYRRPTAARCVC